MDVAPYFGPEGHGFLLPVDWQLPVLAHDVQLGLVGDLLPLRLGDNLSYTC